jgi:hypothetical protein
MFVILLQYWRIEKMDFEDELKWVVNRCMSYNDMVHDVYEKLNFGRNKYSYNECWEMVKMCLLEEMNSRKSED